jgi:exosortase
MKQSQWVQIMVVAPLLAAIAVIATLGVWSEIWQRAFHNPEDSHILLALPVAVWLGFLRRTRLRRWHPEPSLLGPVMIALGWGLILTGFYTATDVFQHLGALLTVGGAVVAVLGHKLPMLLKPSLIALLFLFPVPGTFRQHIAIPLQHVSAIISENLLALFGVAIERSGIVLTINGHDVAVAEACNGMRMVSALGLITFAFVFSVPMRANIRLLLLVFSPLIALVVNIVRLIPTALAYGYTEADTAQLVHDVGGWAVLALALGMLWGLLAILRWLEIPVAPYPVPKVTA